MQSIGQSLVNTKTKRARWSRYPNRIQILGDAGEHAPQRSNTGSACADSAVRGPPGALEFLTLIPQTTKRSLGVPTSVGSQRDHDTILGESQSSALTLTDSDWYPNRNLRPFGVDIFSTVHWGLANPS